MRVGAKMLERMRHLIEKEENTPSPEKMLTVTLREGPIEVKAEVSSYDSLGVALHALTVSGDNSDTALETLAQTISQRITYLWEPLALIERDLEREQAQLRSAPPLIEDKTIEFYEGQLFRQDGSLRIHLVRYRQRRGQMRRDRIPILLTHEVFRRLVDSLAGILRSQAV